MKKGIIIILLLCFILVGCGNKTNENNDANDSADNIVIEPTLEGEREVSIYSLKFYVPNELTVNTYNGINNTYNYYIENTDDNCEVYLTLSSTSKYDNSISKFMNEYVYTSDYSEETINNAKWYAANIDNGFNYSTLIGEYFYNVKTSINQNGTVCSKVNDMIKSTLYVVNK